MLTLKQQGYNDTIEKIFRESLDRYGAELIGNRAFLHESGMYSEGKMDAVLDINYRIRGDRYWR
jgi:hypothetical protein